MAAQAPRSTNGNNTRKSNEDELVPRESIFTWDEIIGHDAKKRLVTVRVVDNRNDEGKVAELDMESFLHSSALKDIYDYLKNCLPYEPEEENIKLIKFWLEDLAITIEHSQTKEEEMAGRLTDDMFALCCGNCKCLQKSDFVIASGEGMLWHRFCCHNLIRCTTHWKSPADVASNMVQSRLLGEDLEDCTDDKPLPDMEVCDKSLLSKKVKAAIRMDTRKNNDTEDAHPSSTWHTNALHNKFAQRFHRLRNDIQAGNRPRNEGAVVVDLFCGISTFLVGLKQVGIKIKTVIHVEHDMVACHVTKLQHNNDGIEHLYVEKFEEMVDGLDNLLEIVGPIDIIVGGPPCQDFTYVNAFRQGAEGLHGKYLIQTGEFIVNVQQRQKEHPLWYLIENVYLRGDDLDKVCKAFGGTTPMQIDSYHFSPCQRNRHYFLNFPVSVDFNPEMDLQARCDDILEDDFMLPQSKLAKANRHESWSKANTLMASKTRMDDDRMIVARRLEGTRREFEIRRFSVTERERMMGLPDGYVGEPVTSLFEVLKPVALMQANTTKVDEDDFEITESWQTLLDEEFHCFAGEKYRFKVYDRSTYCDLKLAPPVNGNKYPTDFFTDEEYAKHLIGNAVSVSVAEMLLRPLKDIFAEGEYESYPYRYSWEQGEELQGNEDDLDAMLEPAGVHDHPPVPEDDHSLHDDDKGSPGPTDDQLLHVNGDNKDDDAEQESLADIARRHRASKAERKAHRSAKAHNRVEESPATENDDDNDDGDAEQESLADIARRHRARKANRKAHRSAKAHDRVEESPATENGDDNEDGDAEQESLADIARRHRARKAKRKAHRSAKAHDRVEELPDIENDDDNEDDDAEQESLAGIARRHRAKRKARRSDKINDSDDESPNPENGDNGNVDDNEETELFDSTRAAKAQRKVHRSDNVNENDDMGDADEDMELVDIARRRRAAKTKRGAYGSDRDDEYDEKSTHPEDDTIDENADEDQADHDAANVADNLDEEDIGDADHDIRANHLEEDIGDADDDIRADPHVRGEDIGDADLDIRDDPRALAAIAAGIVDMRPEDHESFLPINPDHVVLRGSRDDPPEPQPYINYQKKYRRIIWI